MYKKYKIKPDDVFRPDDFPKVINELDAVLLFIASLPAAFKKEILVSFLKRQSLHDDWITANPELTALISSGVLATDHLESLFDSCKQNKQFRQDYENHI